MSYKSINLNKFTGLNSDVAPETFGEKGVWLECATGEI